MNFGEKLAHARVAKRMSQAELAKTVGVSVKSISNYETGSTVPVKQETLKKLADTLEVSLSYLMEYDDAEATLNFDMDGFLAQIQEEYGRRGVSELKAVIEQASTLFAANRYDDDTKYSFYLALTQAYKASKRRCRKDKNSAVSLHQVQSS